jgi:hypothetical protein
LLSPALASGLSQVAPPAGIGGFISATTAPDAVTEVGKHL